MYPFVITVNHFQKEKASEIIAYFEAGTQIAISATPTPQGDVKWAKKAVKDHRTMHKRSCRI